jgi:large subunit ribosomal protein L36e
MAASGIAAGINKGHITTRRTLKAKPSNKIGVSFKWMDGWMDI